MEDIREFEAQNKFANTYLFPLWGFGDITQNKTLNFLNYLSSRLHVNIYIDTDM